MPTIRQIEEIFSPERIITICEDEFGSLAEQIAFNIMTKRTNSGAMSTLWGSGGNDRSDDRKP